MNYATSDLLAFADRLLQSAGLPPDKAQAIAQHAGQTLPVGQQSSRGIEATFGWRPLEALKVEGNLAWVDATLDDFHENVGGVPVSRAGNRPTNTPSRVGNLWVDYAFGPRWSAGLDVRGVSSRYANAANTLSTAGYATWGAHLGFKWNGSTELSVRGRNLGDRTHVVYALGSTMAQAGMAGKAMLRNRPISR